MIELKRDRLVFSFPEVHPKAELTIDFKRTLRIPDDDTTYPLPPGLGSFPLRHVDDFSDNVPPRWVEHGGVMMPMYQSEAMWLNFRTEWVEERMTAYPLAIKVGTGKIDAVTGHNSSNGLHDRPQDYVVASKQPWLDGYCVEKGCIRQFVAMPLGAGYTAEEQITEQAEHGGVQIVVYPMKRELFERRFPVVSERRRKRMRRESRFMCKIAAPAGLDMGLAPGGRMRQEIYEDPFGLDEWDQGQRGRCFVHIANSLVWRAITGREPPTTPPTSKEYSKAGLPWFDYYDDTASAVEGSEILDRLKSVLSLGKEKGAVPLPENESVEPQEVVSLGSGPRKDQVREGRF